MPKFQGFKVIPKIPLDNKDILSLVYTPGVGSSCLAIKNNPENAKILTNKLNSVAVIGYDYGETLKRAMFLKSTLLIDAYPFIIETETTRDDFKFAIENIEINFCAFDLSLIQEFVSDIEFDLSIPILKAQTENLKDFWGTISRNVFMLRTENLTGDIQERSLKLHELAGGVIETELTDQKRNKPVAVVSDGTAVLGYGNIGALASLPVMEGKIALYSEFADVDAVCFCTKTQKPEKLVKIIKIFEKSFSGIHLEDISAPNCFTIEKELERNLDIPVFHDDQHGTAIIVTAGLLNALLLAEKDIGCAKIVISGAGAAGSAVAKLLLFAGAKNIILTDIDGVVYKHRPQNNVYLEELAQTTNPNNEKGSLKDIIKNADVFIGLSKGGILTKEMIKTMEYNPIIFALANPIPEIYPQEAKEAGAYIVSTGRSDYENQVNNSIAFPGLFKGLIDGNIKKVTDAIKLESAILIASMVKDDELSVNQILPDALDRTIPMAISNIIKDKYGNASEN